MTATQFHTRRLLMIMLACVVFTLTGCAGQQQTNKPSKIDVVKTEYEAGQYADAYEHGQSLYRSSNGAAQDQAAYLTGLSAYHLKRPHEARKYLAPLTTNNIPTIAGNAAATLGLIALEADQPESAVDYFKIAQRQLIGPGQANAYYHAGLAYQNMGRVSSARSQFLVALSLNRDQAFQQKVQAELDSSGFTIQIGAFHDLNNAHRTAGTFNRSESATEFGQAKVYQSIDRTGRTLYTVQVGLFHSIHGASRAAGRISSTGQNAIVTRIQ